MATEVPLDRPVAGPELKPFESHCIRVGAGEKVSYVIESGRSRSYTIQTLGAMVTVMVLF